MLLWFKHVQVVDRIRDVGLEEMFLTPTGYAAVMLLKINAIGKSRKHESHIIFRLDITYISP